MNHDPGPAVGQPATTIGGGGRPWPTWLGGTVMLLVVYGPLVLAVVTGYNGPPRNRSVLGIGLLALGMSGLLAVTMAAPLLGEKRSTVGWRLAFVFGGLPYVWNLGVDLVARANAVGTRVSTASNSSAHAPRG